MRWVGLALGGCLLAGSAGCQSLRSLAPQRNRAPELAAASGERDRDAGGQLASLPRKKTVGVLGGQVVDKGNRRRPGALLQIAPLDGGPAFLANADENGYFLVQGLDPGKKYKLTARSRPGEDPLGGTTLASPPNVVVLIKLTEVLPANAPPLEGQPVPAEPKVEKDAPATPAQNRVREYEVPNRGRSATGPARLGVPGNDAEPAGSSANVPVRPEFITKEGSLASAPPMAQIRGPALPSLTPGGTDREAISTGLFNLPLKTLEGGSTTIGEHRGRLTLVYVFGGGSTDGGTALRTLAELERQHRAAGLAVVAISSEDGALTERAERLIFQAGRLHARFPLLLDTDASGGTRKALDVHRLPTALLLDEKGTVVWRAEGLDELRLRELQRELERRLGGRPK